MENFVVLHGDFGIEFVDAWSREAAEKVVLLTIEGAQDAYAMTHAEYAQWEMQREIEADAFYNAA